MGWDDMKMVSIEGIEEKVPQFTNASLCNMEVGTSSWFFSCAMISTCEPLLDSCDDNHEVEAKLISAGVVSHDEVDSESCEFVAYFQDHTDAKAFIKKLNTYLVEKARRSQEADNF